MKRKIIRKAARKSDAEAEAADSTPAPKPKVSKTTRRRKSSTVERTRETAAITPIKAEPKTKKAKVPRAPSRRAVQKSKLATPLTAESASAPAPPASPKTQPGREAFITKPQAPPVISALEEKRAPEVQAPAKSQLVKTPGKHLSRPEAQVKTVLPPTFKLPVPAILLEGDQPTPPPKTGPGEKFAVGVAAPAKKIPPAAEPLPPVYGSGRINAIARDPYCLFVSWDFSDSQQHYYNALSTDKHLVLKAHHGSLSGPVAAEAHLHGETRHWFLHVPRPAAQYVVEIGYYLADGSWITVRSAEPVTTQPDRPSEDLTARFAYAAPFTPRLEPSSDGGATTDSSALPLLAGPTTHLQERTSRDYEAPAGWESHPTIITPVLPESRPAVEPPHWTAAQEEALTELISTMIRREQVPGSIELLELLQRQVQRQVFPLEEEFGPAAPSSAALGISSPGPGEVPSSPTEAQRRPPRKGFWFNVNAELIIYGATEPDAHVTIGGRRIKLRPDGTFSYRFALPDGQYELPAQATSADQTDSRRAELRFSRHTAYTGEVGAHPQDKTLRIPAPENVA